MTAAANVLLNSGGLDSLMLAHYLGKNTTHVWVDVGQKYAGKEFQAAHRIAKAVGADLEMQRGAHLGRFEHESGIIPFRNAELILCAAQYGNNVYLGVLAHEINSDKSAEFMDAMEKVLNISHQRQYWTGGKTFTIATPLRTMTKSEALARYVATGGTWEAARDTVSCYDAGDRHCGRCSSCFKRWVAFMNCGAPFDVTKEFVHDPAVWRTRKEWQQTLPNYATRRAAEVKGALFMAGITL